MARHGLILAFAIQILPIESGQEKSPLQQFEIWVGCLLQWQAVMQPLTRTLIVMDAASGSVGMTMVMILNKEMLLLFNLEMDSL